MGNIVSGMTERSKCGLTQIAIDAKAGNIYQSIEFPVKYPVASKTSCRPVLSIGGGGAIWGNVYGSSDNFKSGFKYHVLAATSWGKASFTLSYYVRGTWK